MRRANPVQPMCEKKYQKTKSILNEMLAQDIVHHAQKHADYLAANPPAENRHEIDLTSDEEGDFYSDLESSDLEEIEKETNNNENPIIKIDESDFYSQFELYQQKTWKEQAEHLENKGDNFSLKGDTATSQKEKSLHFMNAYEAYAKCLNLLIEHARVPPLELRLSILYVLEKCYKKEINEDVKTSLLNKMKSQLDYLHENKAHIYSAYPDNHANNMELLEGHKAFYEKKMDLVSPKKRKHEQTNPNNNYKMESSQKCSKSVTHTALTSQVKAKQYKLTLYTPSSMNNGNNQVDWQFNVTKDTPTQTTRKCQK